MTYPRQWGVLCLACILAGCGTDVQLHPPQVADATGGNAEDVLFAEDADPAMAALPFVENELLVQHYPGADAGMLADLYVTIGAVVVDELGDIGLTVLEVPPGELQTTAARLAESGLFETVQKNYLYEPSKIPDDPMYSRQMHLTQIRAADAWETTVGAGEVVIAIVDTGVDRDHPDLADKILDGWNVYSGNSDYSDVHGHGTLVAGVAAAASDNSLGVTGVAWDSPLLAVRATDERGRSSARYLAAGILWAVNHDARAINVSFAPLRSNRVVRAAAQQAFNHGCLVVISAGNTGQTSSSPGYSEALFVGAIDSSDRVASFSDRGPFVDLVAPGTGVLATELGGDYDLANGTSFAAPIASGVAALAWSVNPDLRPVSIQAAILNSTVDLGASGKDDTYGYGAVDAAAAVDEALNASFVPDRTPPNLRVQRPSDGDVLAGRYTTWVTATDRWGVADVVLSIDGMPYATDTRAPYRFVIDTGQFPAGSHELAFVATDLAGNPSEAKTVTVTFRTSTTGTGGTASEIVFTFPPDGASVSGNVTIQATVSDPDGLAAVEWFVDGGSLFVSHVSGRSTGVSFLWRTAGPPEVDAGPHTITLVVTDARGNQITGQLDLIKR